MLKGKTVVLAISGSIAAYKMANVARMLLKQHCDVEVLMTQNATQFINPITFESLTGHKCLVDTFDRNFQYSVEHVALAKRADVVLVAPASANVIGKIANGIADDMLTIIAGDDKPIKCVYEGDPIVVMGDPLSNGDLTQEYLYGEKYGMGIVLAGGNAGIGRYEIA